MKGTRTPLRSKESNIGGKDQAIVFPGRAFSEGKKSMSISKGRTVANKKVYEAEELKKGATYSRKGGDSGKTAGRGWGGFKGAER